MCCRHMMTSSHPVNNASTYHPHQLASGCQLPADTAAISMTLQQKIYQLNVIEFEKPVMRELPAYIDVNDPRWLVDPRVQPCVRHSAAADGEQTTAAGIGHGFYSSDGGSSVSDAGCTVQQPAVSSAYTATSSHVSLTCDHITADIVSSSGAHGCSSVESGLVNSVCDRNSSVACENSPDLPSKPENITADVITAEPVDTCNASTAPVARHMFQHNVSWLSVTRSSGVQKLSHTKN